MKIVLDTNCLLPSIFKSSPYYWLWQAFRNFDFTLCYTTEILNEYEEKMCEHYSESVAKSIIDELLNAVNTQKSAPYYKWNLIHTDPLFGIVCDSVVSEEWGFSVGLRFRTLS